eukprot:TRINITY_DN13476_c0_g1_i1.p1 TRINITY_DN13476_c0_g1~~TRINITY_DN13476_c0_g1_i1.p1  ORF type:complete len:873 (+),score=134.38 TRINITY_DN13476_c0_g1_i1:1386-4004(+)
MSVLLPATGGLALIKADDLPDAFSEIKWILARNGGAVIHHASVVDERRLLLLSDRALYLYTMGGSLERCVRITSIREAMHTEEGIVGLCIPEEHDIKFNTGSGDDSKDLISTLCIIYNRISSQSLLVRSVSHETIMRTLLLKPQPNWTPAAMVPFSYDGGNANEPSVVDQLVGKQKEIEILKSQLQNSTGAVAVDKIEALEKAVQGLSERLTARTLSPEQHVSPVRTPGVQRFATQQPMGTVMSDDYQPDNNLRSLAVKLTKQVTAATTELSKLKESQRQAEQKQHNQVQQQQIAQLQQQLQQQQQLLQQQQQVREQSPDNQTENEIRKRLFTIESLMGLPSLSDNLSPAERIAKLEGLLHNSIQEPQSPQIVTTPPHNLSISLKRSSKSPKHSKTPSKNTMVSYNDHRGNGTPSERRSSLASHRVNTIQRRSFWGEGLSPAVVKAHQQMSGMASEKKQPSSPSKLQMKRIARRQKTLPAMFKCVTSGLYHTVRSEPDIESDKIGELKPGDIIEAQTIHEDEDEHSWLRLSTGGWCLEAIDDDQLFLEELDPGTSNKVQPRGTVQMPPPVAAPTPSKTKPHPPPLDDFSHNTPPRQTNSDSGTSYDDLKGSEIDKLTNQIKSLEELVCLQQSRFDTELSHQKELIRDELSKMTPISPRGMVHQQVPQSHSVQYIPTGYVQPVPVTQHVPVAVPVPVPIEPLEPLRQSRDISPHGYEVSSPVAADYNARRPLSPTYTRQVRSVSPPHPDHLLDNRNNVQIPSYDRFWRIVAPSGCVVRTDASISSRQVAHLQLAEVVEVSEISGKRARIISPVTGWVSIISAATGVQLMIPSAKRPASPRLHGPTYRRPQSPINSTTPSRLRPRSPSSRRPFR